MNPHLKRLELCFWTVVPSCITLLLLVIYMIPKHLWGLAAFMPLLPLLPVFYWGVLQATEMPYWFVFITGLLMDAANGMPLGISAMLYVFFLAAIHAQHKYIYKEGFIIVWGYFALLLFGMCALQWLLMSFTGRQWHTMSPALLQWLLTVCCYPLAHKGFDRLNEHCHMRRWKIIHV